MTYLVPSGVSVEIPDHVRDEIFSLCTKAFPYETGGIIYGKYIENNLCASVVGISSASYDSRAGRTWFHRGVGQLQDLLNKLWSRQIYYIGEWHFHPNGVAYPSDRDLKSLGSIAKSKTAQCKDPIMLIVCGTLNKLSFRLYLVNAQSEFVEANPQS
jgi:integrative and conjugative element protein (TIGR02256 family)